MSEIQALVDGMNAVWMKERAETQMTLGQLIARLETLPDGVSVPLGNSHSYRGYYSDLGFEPIDQVPVKELLKECRDSMGQSFTGYKGGDFYMHAGVPVWVSNYGECGLKLMAVNDDGSLTTAVDD